MGFNYKLTGVEGFSATFGSDSRVHIDVCHGFRSETQDADL